MTDNQEILMEITRIGNAVRVTAIHAATGTEVVFQAPANCGQAELQRLAANKLNYIMKKK
jgi:predicted metal-dependent hydrolase